MSSDPGEDVSAQINRADVLATMGQLDAARKALYSVASSSQEDPSWHQVLAFIAFKDGDLDSAEDAAREAVRLGPNDAMNHYNLAYYIAERGPFRANAALDTVNRSLALDPQDGDAHLLAARILIAAGDKDTGGWNAMAAIEEAERLGVDSALAHNTRAWVHLQCGRPAAARLETLEGLKEHPNDEGLLLGYVDSLGERGFDQREAGDVLRATLASSPSNEGARNELLRRLHVVLLRSRYGVVAAQVLAGACVMLPVAWRMPLAGLGLVATLLFLYLDDRTASRLAGREAFQEYLQGHDGLRQGRGLVRAAAVCAWVPLAMAGVLTGGQWWWTALISVPLGSALAWIGAGLAMRSTSGDKFDPTLTATRAVQSSWWQHAMFGESLETERRLNIIGMVVALGLAMLGPPGVGIAAMALGASAVQAIASDARIKWHLLASVKQGLIPDVGVVPDVPGRVVLVIYLLIMHGFVLAVAVAAVILGFANVLRAVSGG